MPANTADKVTTYNHDIAGICTRMHRFIYELHKSVSSGLSLTNTYDQDRLASYINAVRGYRDWIVSMPQLDLPESHPRLLEVTLLPDEQLEDIENESLRDVCRMMKIGIIEMAGSQSSRAASGLVKFDEMRLTAIIDKVDAFLTNYISKIDPLDLPESSPAYPMTTAGKTGV